jgi:hypothetical protein
MKCRDFLAALGRDRIFLASKTPEMGGCFTPTRRAYFIFSLASIVTLVCHEQLACPCRALRTGVQSHQWHI